MIHPIIAIDLGSRPAIVIVTGTAESPIFRAARRWWKWDSAEVLWHIRVWLHTYPDAVVWCEETFSHGTKRKSYLRDVGRKQEHQAGYLEGALAGECEVLRVPPVSGAEAQAAWQVFGRPSEGEGAKGEHVRDSLGIALKALIRQAEGSE